MHIHYCRNSSYGALTYFEFAGEFNLTTCCSSVLQCVSRALTCAGGCTDGDQVGPVLCDGLDGQLVLAQWTLLHDGDRRQWCCLGALDDAAYSPYRGCCDGWHRLHFH